LKRFQSELKEERKPPFDFVGFAAW
jgi:hypothetical protein